jgi:hypothetical protein
MNTDLTLLRRYEEVAAEVLHERAEPTWEELEPLIDQALEELPAKLREPLVEHFLESRTQQEVAARLDVSQSAVSGVGAGAVMAAAKAPVWKTALAWLLHPATAAVALLLGVGALVFFQSHPAIPPPAVPASSPVVESLKQPVASWRGRAFCPRCALPFTNNRQTEQGIFIHTENGQDIVYDLRLPQPVPDFHQRFCSESMRSREAMSARGATETRDGLRWLFLEQLEVAPK